MKTRWLGTIAGLAVTALTIGAVPAFTADSGTVTVTVTAAAPAAPCIEFATPPGTSINFGTLPFSRVNAPSAARGDINPRFRNCGTRNEQIQISGTDATSGSTTWTLITPTFFDCGHPPSTPLNGYKFLYFLDNNPAASFGKTPSQLVASALPGVDHDLIFDLFMPCEGSDGAGQTFSASIVLTAAVV